MSSEDHGQKSDGLVQGGDQHVKERKTPIRSFEGRSLAKPGRPCKLVEKKGLGEEEVSFFIPL